MNVANGYGVAGSYGDYNAGKTSQTSNKPFTIPTSELTEEKPAQTQKVSTKIGGGTISFSGEHGFNPFKTGGVDFPKYMQTRTAPTRSDEEILKEIEELAKEHARTGQSNTGDKKFIELMDEYVSSVSPDRASILKNAVTEINERLNPQGNSDYSMSNAFQQIDQQRTQKEDKKEKEPIDYFLEALKNKGKPKGSSGATSTITRNGSYHTETIDYGDGKKTYLNYVNGEFTSMQIEGKNYFVGGIDNGSGAVKSAEFFDDNGNKLMHFSGNKDGLGLIQKYTEAEGDRLHKVLGTYNAAYDVAVGRHLGAINSSETNKEAYNSTYEKLTSGAVA